MRLVVDHFASAHERVVGRFGGIGGELIPRDGTSRATLGSPFGPLRRCSTHTSIVAHILHVFRGAATGGWRPVMMVLLLSPGRAAEWAVRTWNAEDGLPNNAVSSVGVTPDGYLWVGTASGLARFDGYRFESFASQAIVPSPEVPVRMIGPGRVGGLWLGLNSGPVARIRAGTLTIFGPELSGVSAQTMVEDADGAAWVLYRNGKLRRFDASGAAAATDESRWPQEIAHIAADEKGGVWCAVNRQLGRLTRDGFTMTASLPEGRPLLAPRRGGGVWVCIDRRVFVCDEDASLREIGPFAAVAPQDGVSALWEDREQALWIGTTTDGLWRFASGHSERIAIPHPSVRGLTEDRQGDMWVGTLGGGLCRIQRRAVFLDDKDSGLPFQPIQSLDEDSSGNVWAVLQSGGIRRRVDGRWQSLGAAEPESGANAIACAPEGMVWIGSRNAGLFSWRDGALTKFEAFAYPTVHSLLVARDGTLWVTTPASPEVVRVRRGEARAFFAPRPIRTARAIVEDTAGRIWVGGADGGLLRIDGDDVVDESSRHSGDVPRSVRCVAATPDGAVWIGYFRGGVVRWKAGRYASISEGLYDQNISQIVADGFGYLWFGSDNGIFKVRQSELDAVADGREKRVHSVTYGAKQDLPVLQPYGGRTPLVMRSPTGRLWMPTQAGVVGVDPVRLRQRAEPLAPRVTHARVDDTTFFWDAAGLPLRLGPRGYEGARAGIPRHRRLVFEFSAPNLAAPEHVIFRYRLEGLEEEWIDANNERTVSYPRLLAGRYRFLVQATHAEGDSPPAIGALEFVVHPLPWETWWFRTGLVAAGIGAAILMARYFFLRRLRLRLAQAEQAAALDRERTRIARDLHDDLGTRLTHLALLSGMAERDPANTERTLGLVRQISGTVRQVADALDETVWAINPRGNTVSHLVDYISQFAVEFVHAADLACDIDLPADSGTTTVSGQVRHNLFLAVKETLNNVARHAAATRVGFRVTVGDELTIVISDDGRGFAPGPEVATADGLRNLRQRLAEIGGRAEIRSQPGAGTTVQLTVPLGARRPLPIH